MALAWCCVNANHVAKPNKIARIEHANPFNCSNLWVTCKLNFRNRETATVLGFEWEKLTRMKHTMVQEAAYWRRSPYTVNRTSNLTSNCSILEVNRKVCHLWSLCARLCLANCFCVTFHHPEHCSLAHLYQVSLYLIRTLWDFPLVVCPPVRPVGRLVVRCVPCYFLNDSQPQRITHVLCTIELEHCGAGVLPLSICHLLVIVASSVCPNLWSDLVPFNTI